MSMKEKYIGEAQMKSELNKKFSLKIKANSITNNMLQDNIVSEEKLQKDSVTEDKIKDENISWPKLDFNVKNIIETSGGQHGIPLSIEFGDSDQLGITQRVLTESRNSLQSQIDAIVSEKAVVSLAATPATIFVGEPATINLVADTDTAASSIKIKKGTTELASGSGTHLLSGTTLYMENNGSTTYGAEFVISGIIKTTSKNVTAVYPIYYGAGAAYTDIDDNSHRASARTGYAGTYNITNGANGQYIIFCIPTTISTQKPTAKMNGFDFPLADGVDATINGAAYKVYLSIETQDAGTYPIVLS